MALHFVVVLNFCEIYQIRMENVFLYMTNLLFYGKLIRFLIIHFCVKSEWK